MGKYGYRGQEQFEPISAWGYVGYTFLFCIPLIGFIIWLVFAFSRRNINRRSYARSFFCMFLLTAIIFAGLTGVVAVTHFDVDAFRKNVQEWNSQFMEQVADTYGDLSQMVGKLSDRRSGEKRTDKPSAQVTDNNEGAKVTAAQKTSPAKDQGTKNASGALGVRKEVKDAIDGYEAFFREYTDFMKKYTKSSNPLSMITDYTQMLTRYAENMEKWDKFDESYTMNDAEMKYYTDATLRIEKMLLDTANDK